MTRGKKIILGVTGSIAAYKAGEIIRRLKDQGAEVTVVMTREAEHFITPLTLKSLSERKIYRDLFSENDDTGRRPLGEMEHIALAREADLLLIAPATANIIGKIAHGLADSLLSCIVLASEAPLLIAPAMNDKMYGHPAVQENITCLKGRGVRFVDPVEGKLACGTEGIGHLAEVESIIEAVEKIFL